MTALARLWIVLPGASADAPPALFTALAARPLALVSSPPRGPAHALAERLAAAAGAPHAPAADLAAPAPSSRTALDRLAGDHADAELALVLEARVLEAILRDVLELPAATGLPFELTPGATTALDWSTSRSAPRRTQLVGHDLDWLPPWTAAAARTPYPGGPGAAGSARR